MLDLELIRKNPEFVKERLKTRGEGFEELVDKVMELDHERRSILRELESLRAERNAKSKENVIRNTDYAEEMANFTKLQIKMQSSIAMLAQANQLPQLALQLLR